MNSKSTTKRPHKRCRNKSKVSKTKRIQYKGILVSSKAKMKKFKNKMKASKIEMANCKGKMVSS